MSAAQIRFILGPVKRELEDARPGIPPPVIKLEFAVGLGARRVWYGEAQSVDGGDGNWSILFKWIQDQGELLNDGDEAVAPEEDGRKGNVMAPTGLLPPRNAEYDTFNICIVSQATVPQSFQGGQTHTPSLAARTGAYLAGLGMRSHLETPNLAWDGLSVGVRKQHRQILRALSAMTLDLQNMPIANAVIEYNQRATAKNWTPATHLRNLASTMGALARLDMYTTSPTPIPLAWSSTWRDAMKAARMKANKSQPDPPGLSWEQVEACVQDAMDSGRQDLAALLLLTYAIGARASDVIQLTKSEILLAPTSLRVEFRRGKGVAFRGPYTVHGAMANPDHRRIVNQHLAAGDSRWAWHCTTPQQRTEVQADLLRLIRRHGPRELRQSSIRRGALQHMATCGNQVAGTKFTEADLMHFSGHTQVATLRRYLGWGKVSVTADRTRELAAQHTARPRGSTA
jgi:integrase